MEFCLSSLIILLLCITTLSAALGGPDSYYAEVNGFAVEWNNKQTPKFFFSHNGGPRYQLRFQQIFEVTGSDGDYSQVPSSTISLPSLQFDITPVNNDTKEFNITTTYPGRFDKLTFINHLGVDNEPKLKFDVELINYEWINPDAKLVFVFFLTGGNNESNNDGADASGERATYRNSYFSIKPNAIQISDSSSIPVTLYGDKGKATWIIYDHFNGSLFHDPEFGIASSSTNVVAIVAGVVGGLIVLVAIIGVIIFLWRRKKYTTL